MNSRSSGAAIRIVLWHTIREMLHWAFKGEDEERMAHEWTEYAAGPTGSETCREFTRVSHTAHFAPATAIVRDGQIKAGLVYDKSRLNDSRTLVVWVSPNYWNNGFIYGGVQFLFDWEPLVRGKSAYYVETMKEYSPHACRILLTEKEHPELTPYDPSQRGGPWWRDPLTETNYYHGRMTLEFMLETSLDAVGIRAMDFQGHHPSICNVHGRSRFCAEAKLTREATRARFIAALIGESIAHKAPQMTTGEYPDKRAVAELRGGWYDLERRLQQLSHAEDGPVGRSHVASSALARAILLRYGSYEFMDVTALTAIFSSPEVLMETLRAEAESAFELPTGALLRDE